MAQTGEYRIQPELHLRDGRIIRSLGDAMALLREHESRPGIYNRDEVLHGLERAQTDEQRQKAAAGFFAGPWNSTSFVVRRSRRGARSEGGARTPSGVDTAGTGSHDRLTLTRPLASTTRRT